MSLYNIAQIVGVALLVFASAAGVIGYFRANISKATIELYKEDNEALRTRLLTLEEEAKQYKAEITALKSAHAYLSSVVTQAEAITALRNRVEQIAAKLGA